MSLVSIDSNSPPATPLSLNDSAWLPPGQDLRQDKVLVLGLGNDLLCDDGIGLNIIRALPAHLAGDPRIDLLDTCEMGLSLLDFIAGYHSLVLVDAVQTRSAPAGFLHEIGLDDLKILPLMTPHFFGIGEIMALGRQLGLPMPEQVRIFAVEVADPFTVSTDMTAPLRDELPSLTDRVAAAARELAGKSNADS